MYKVFIENGKVVVENSENGRQFKGGEVRNSDALSELNELGNFVSWNVMDAQIVFDQLQGVDSELNYELIEALED